MGPRGKGQLGSLQGRRLPYSHFSSASLSLAVPSLFSSPWARSSLLSQGLMKASLVCGGGCGYHFFSSCPFNFFFFFFFPPGVYHVSTPAMDCRLRTVPLLWSGAPVSPEGTLHPHLEDLDPGCHAAVRSRQELLADHCSQHTALRAARNTPQCHREEARVFV